jgi:pimeloyl-ACP methyl ester carboxylesterase
MPEAQELATHTIDSGGVRLHCVSAGRPTDAMVLLLHGFPARWSTWRQPMRALANAGFFAVAPDLRGYGDSDKPESVSAYSSARFIDDVAAIVRGFGRKQVCLAGHDFGGGVAWAVAMAHPDLVSRLAILNSVHPVGIEREMRKWSQVKKSWYVFFFLLPWVPEWLLSRHDFRFLRRSLADDGLSEDVIEDLLAGVRSPRSLHAAIDTYRASFRDGIRGRIPRSRVDVPTLVIWGDRERHLNASLADPPADCVSSARVVHVPEASHWVHHDAPDEVAALLVEHFAPGVTAEPSRRSRPLQTLRRASNSERARRTAVPTRPGRRPVR